MENSQVIMISANGFQVIPPFAATTHIPTTTTTVINGLAITQIATTNIQSILLCESCEKKPRVYPIQISWENGLIRYFCEECVQKCAICDTKFKSIGSRKYCTTKNCERELCDNCMDLQLQANITCPNCGLKILCGDCFQNGKCGRCTICVGCEKKPSSTNCNHCSKPNLTNLIYCKDCVDGRCNVCPKKNYSLCCHKNVFDSCIFGCSDCSKKICIDCTPLCVECSDGIGIRHCQDCFKGKFNNKAQTCGYCCDVTSSLGVVCHTCDEFKWDIYCEICPHEDESTRTVICEKCFSHGATCSYCKTKFCKKHESIPNVCTNCISKEALNLKQFQQCLMVFNRKGLRNQARNKMPDDVLKNVFNFMKIKDSVSFDIYKQTLRALKREQKKKKRVELLQREVLLETISNIVTSLPFPSPKRRKIC